ncbi:putative methyltransferase NSUN7 [Notolabrus celidotus]|uniref:putative methyltransferase NSUN7 n=1 Tax=Notolabrus celidotus TaxID=1203425 RepID=UPI00148F75AF|nr:putative methyltransferase NSUN7 [Notolabrus celidotus]
MSCAAPTRMILNDKADSSEDVNTNAVTEEISISNQVDDQQNNREPLKFLLPFSCLPSSLSTHVSAPSDQVYMQAAAIFQRLRTEKTVKQQLLHYEKKTGTPLPEIGDKTTQRQAFQLAFNTLKYQDLLEDIITDSCFNTSQHISRDLLPLAMVMLCDFQDRRFSLHERLTKEREEPLHEVRDMESSLLRCKTKLAASLARCRVKQSLQSVSCFLSDPVRTKQHRAKRLPLYAWVNTLKTSVEEVCEALKNAGLREVKNLSELEESAFCRDPLCPDTLVFSPQLHALLLHSTVTHALNTQDRSVCVAVSTLRPLLFENSDVLVVGSFSAVTVAHIAVVAAARSGRVLVCGADHTPSHIEETQGLLTQMDIKNVKVLSEVFCNLDEWDARIQRLKVIIVLPQCSSSALNDPVPTMHSEHGDWDLLPDLCRSSVSQNKKHAMATQQARLLAHALSFPKVQTVVYCTRSVYPEENEQLVKRVLEKTHTPSKLLPFRVNGPIFPDELKSVDATDTKFFRLESSQFTNGCFIARLSRQADPTKVETVQDVLARAAAKGLLGGIIPEQSKTGKKGKSKKNRVASADSRPPSPQSQGRQTGGELESGKDQVAYSEEEEQRGECNEEKEVKGGKKKRGLKGHKRKAKQQSKQNSRTTAGSKNPSQSHKKKPKKRETKRRLTKTKPRRIPRLTLTLISSAKPPKHLSPITALAHKLIDAPAVKPQLTVFSTPTPANPVRPAPPAASKQVQRKITETVKAERTIKDAAKPDSLGKMRGKTETLKTEKVTQVISKLSDFVLPPISFQSSSSLSGKSVSSPSQRPSRASHSELTQISASSSCISLPGL